MTYVNPLLRNTMAMIKDVGNRLVVMGHEMTNVRLFYPVCRHQNVRVYRGLLPITEDAAYIAPNAAIVGNVIFGHDSCAMYHCSIRNYHSNIATRLGDGTCVLDNTSFMGQITIGNNTVIGVGTSLDSCTIHDNVLIGSGCAIALGATIEQGAILASGSVVPRDARIPSNELWAGNPAEKVHDVTEEERNRATAIHKRHVKIARSHRIAIQQHNDESAKYDYEWLQRICKQIEAQQTQVAFPVDIPLPVDALRFVQPRVHARLPAMHARTSYPVNRIAPHMRRPPDPVGNA